MVKIVLPLAVPGILSAGIFASTLSWNEFLYALVFLSSPENKTGPVGVTGELILGDVFFRGRSWPVPCSAPSPWPSRTRSSSNTTSPG